MTNNTEQSSGKKSHGFTARALGHLGQRFYVESVSAGGSEVFAFLGRLVSIEKTFNHFDDDPANEPVSVNYVIEAKAGLWDKARVDAAMQDPNARLQLISDWKEADEVTRFVLSDLTHSSTLSMQVVLQETVVGPPIFADTYKLSGLDNEYRWQFIDG